MTGLARPDKARRSLSVKFRLGAGAALLAAGTALTALILYAGMTQVAVRLDTALAAEKRMERFSSLSTQVSTLLVVATEAVQTGLEADERAGRIAPVAAAIGRTFDLLQRDQEAAVRAAAGQGIDRQSRHGTQSLVLARMEAMLKSAVSGLSAPTADRDRLRAQIDMFAARFAPLLNQAMNTEAVFRHEALEGIRHLRATLSGLAVSMAAAAAAMSAWFYFGLIRPQFGRLDRLRAAAEQIGREDFAVNLPEARGDEIGALYAETNRMARAMAERQAFVAAEWARLNDTIAARTEALSAANARLERVDRTRRRFFADVSHELRTPLTVILTEAQIGRRGGAGPEGFAVIEDRAARLNRRIDDLLRVARSESGELALEREALDLKQVRAGVVEEVSAECAAAGIVLQDAGVSGLRVMGDPNWVRQVIVGLVRNAIRHARQGGVVRLEPVAGAGMAGIAVVDNGPGIAEAEQGRMFDRFAQGSAANPLGFGIGLALARWVVEAQDGEIAVESPVCRDAAIGAEPGTRVSVLLPRAAE